MRKRRRFSAASELNALNEKFDRLVREVVKNSADIGNLKDLTANVMGVRDNTWLILDRIDNFAKKTALAMKEGTAKTTDST